MKVADVAALADGRIFSGQDAEIFKLVDRMGNLEDAVQWAADLAGVKGAVQAVYPRRKKLSLSELLDASAVEGVLDRALHPEIKAEYRYRPAGE
jgi:protease-4